MSADTIPNTHRQTFDLGEAATLLGLTPSRLLDQLDRGEQPALVELRAPSSTKGEAGKSRQWGRLGSVESERAAMHSQLYRDLGNAPRPTIYQGRTYRTRSEAKWACVLTELDLPFYYEPSHYRLASGLYLPDFWLPTLDAYIEVKPCDVADPRYGELGEMRGKRVFVVSGDMPHIPLGWSEREVLPNLTGHIWLKWPDDEPDYMLAVEHQGRVNIVPIALASSAQGNHPAILGAYLVASSYKY